MTYTHATVIIAATDRIVAQSGFPGTFTAEFTDGKDFFCVCTGMWNNCDLTKIVNDVIWSRKVYFGSVEEILESLNLVPFVSSSDII